MNGRKGLSIAAVVGQAKGRKRHLGQVTRLLHVECEVGICRNVVIHIEKLQKPIRSIRAFLVLRQRNVLPFKRLVADAEKSFDCSIVGTTFARRLHDKAPISVFIYLANAQIETMRAAIPNNIFTFVRFNLDPAVTGPIYDQKSFFLNRSDHKPVFGLIADCECCMR